MPKASVIQAVAQWSNKKYLAKRELPAAPDGLYDWQAGENAEMSKEANSTLTNVINTVTAIKRNNRTVQSAHVTGFIDMALHPAAQNDRKGGFQTGLDIMSRLPPNSSLGAEMSDSAVGMLYNSLAHPPTAYLGDNASFRHADGGFNNMNQPDLGRAGTPYARNVQSKMAIPLSDLPEPGLVVDALLRTRGPKDHIGGNSGLIFAFASLVSHSLFRTNPRDWSINDTSSYLDLSPLYGHDQASQDLVRDKASGRGLLWNDTFSEERLFFQPPAVNALLVLFSRNHNYIAKMLLNINERKLWTDPPPADPAAFAKQDEEIFQTARHVNCGHFREIVMNDYVASFFGLSDGNSWTMNAFDPIKMKNGQVIPRGEGNHVSVEFNLLYRWHPTLSQKDEAWTNNLIDEIFEKKPYDQIDMDDLQKNFRKAVRDVEAEPKKRVFGGLVRDSEGRFADADIARFIQDSTESPGGQFRGRGSPDSLRIIEILTIIQARKWNVCTMNEFRKFLNLKPFESFEEWTDDKEIAQAARQLYNHVDNLELYPGLQCETTTPLSSGLKFACGYTITQGVLAEAICLIRGDRFMSTDYTPALLTTWGYDDCRPDSQNGGFGGSFPKLLFRHLGTHYPYNNVYGLFPFFTPKKMKECLEIQKISDEYTFDRPIPIPTPVVLTSLTSIKFVSESPSMFKTLHHSGATGKADESFIISLEDSKSPVLEDTRSSSQSSTSPLIVTLEDPDFYLAWYQKTIPIAIKTYTLKHHNVSGTYVDIVKAINYVAIHWASDKLCGISLKTPENPRGIYTVYEVHAMFTALFNVSFLSFGKNERLFSQRKQAAIAYQEVKNMVSQSLAVVDPSRSQNPLRGLRQRVVNLVHPAAQKSYYEFVHSISSSKNSQERMVADIIGLAVTSSVTQAQAAINVVDFYLQDAYSKEKEDIQQLVKLSNASSTTRLQGYVREAMRLNPQLTSLWRECVVDTEIPEGEKSSTLQVKKGDLVVTSLRNAHLDPAHFPNPESVDPTRPKGSYILCESGFHSCPGDDFAETTITEIVKVVFGLKNLRRATGDAGRLVGFTKIIDGYETNVYTQPSGELTAWPTSMHVVFD